MNKSNIYCIWYPSGGFGHFVNAVLSLYGTGFQRPDVVTYDLSLQGNSHSLPLVAKKYFHDPENYNFDFEPDKKYSVLIDNGIDNESKKFLNFFPNSTVIKICYTDYSWPVIAQTLICKAMNKDLVDELAVDQDAWTVDEPWAQREKYFLYLRDHDLRHKWKAENNYQNLLLESLTDYKNFKESLGVDTKDFQHLWTKWWQSNQRYFAPVIVAKNILNGNWPAEPVTDIWTQAVLYYQIWCKYGIEVPHNDYSNWFENQQHLAKMLNDNGVTIDRI